MNKNLLFFSFLLFIAIIANAQNPWQQAKGEVLISPYISTYFTNSLRDVNGNKRVFGNDGSYQQINPKVYFSLALDDYKLNLFGNIPFISNQYEDNLVNQQNNEFSDVEIGIRKHLKKIGEYHYLMASASAYLPLYSNNIEPFTGLGVFGLELKLHLGGNFKFLNPNKNFHKVEFGIRKFLPNIATQYRLYLSQGYKLNKNWIVFGEVDTMVSKSNNREFSEQNAQFVTDFDLGKLSLSVGYEVNENLSFFLGGFRDVWNRNLSIGRGFQVFSILKL